MKFERFTKLLILTLSLLPATLLKANTPFPKPSQVENTNSLLERMETTILMNVSMMTPDLKLKETSLDDRLELHYEEFFDKVLAGAHKFIGTPYRTGGRSPKGFDCSGFTSFIFSRYGVKLSPSSRNQVNDGRRIARNEIKKGDLIFFKGRNSKSSVIGHVGIVTDTEDNGRIRFIHSATTGGVRVSTLDEPYYKQRYVGSVRVEPKMTKL